MESKCGSCLAGIVLDHGEVQRCDECKRFKDDDHAASAVIELLEYINLVGIGNVLPASQRKTWR